LGEDEPRKIDIDSILLEEDRCWVGLGASIQRTWPTGQHIAISTSAIVTTCNGKEDRLI